jgi:hypothetical protein
MSCQKMQFGTHRILKCYVVVELKVDKFRHEYASQLNMYLNYYTLPNHIKEK